ncbi:MAG: DUF192 domain-containing protein [Candidatus Nanoarchaeia archaeon]
MKTKTKIMLCFLTIILVLSLFQTGCIIKEKASRVCFEQKCFFVEKVSTPETREIGLMYRTSLDEDKGMLFVFENESIYPFWMKNTLIPLDIIWIDSSGKIVYVYSNAQPCGEGSCPPIYPNSSAKYVLEINAGLAEKYNLNENQNIRIY